MAVFDVRHEETDAIDSVVFSERMIDDYTTAYFMEPFEDVVKIKDGYDHVMIANKQHALNLIKALNKAIDLGWLK